MQKCATPASPCRRQLACSSPGARARASDARPVARVTPQGPPRVALERDQRRHQRGRRVEVRQERRPAALPLYVQPHARLSAAPAVR
eukprot:1149747-Pyramimonas_sp.AAC.1